METSDFRSASGLHCEDVMKRVAVAILAMVLVSGCGVGADEFYDGENLVSASGQALEVQEDPQPSLPPDAIPQPTGTTVPSPFYGPGTVALPQDPIPVFEGRPLPTAPPVLEPMLGGTPRPPVR